MSFFILAAIIVAGDQLLKYWVIQNIALGEVRSFIPGILQLTYVENSGAAFSILSSHTWILTVFSLVAIVAVSIFLIKTKMSRGAKLCIAAVLGGAVGNAIDRLVSGAVVDMFEVSFMDFAVFNLADCFIVVGGIGFCIFYIIHSVRADRAEKAEKLAERAEKTEKTEKTKKSAEPKRKSAHKAFDIEAEERRESRTAEDIAVKKNGNTFGHLLESEEWTETSILEEFDYQRRLEESDHD